MTEREIAEILKKVDTTPFTKGEILALIRKESGFNEDSYRHEPGYWKRYMRKNLSYWEQHFNKLYHRNPKNEQEISKKFAASYGLMQTMYSVALGQGFNKKPEGLFIAEVSIDIGLKYLKSLYNRFPEIKISEYERRRFTIGAYNAGRGNINKMLVLARKDLYGNGSYRYWREKLGGAIGPWMKWEVTSKFLKEVTGEKNADITLRHNNLIFTWAKDYNKRYFSNDDANDVIVDILDTVNSKKQQRIKDVRNKRVSTPKVKSAIEKLRIVLKRLRFKFKRKFS